MYGALIYVESHVDRSQRLYVTCLLSSVSDYLNALYSPLPSVIHTSLCSSDRSWSSAYSDKCESAASRVRIPRDHLS